MPQSLAETCLNVWCIVDEGTGMVYRIAARAYALNCPDDEKGNLLKRLAMSDFHLARELQALSKYRTEIVDDEGRVQTARGLFPDSVHAVFPDILDGVCKELERDVPVRPIADVGNPRTYKMKFPAEPYYVLTFLVENARGELTPVSA